MLKYCVALLCIVAACNAGAISPVTVSRKVNNPFGIVEGIISCGSAGEIHETRVTDCTRVPCTLVATRQYTIGIDFTPSKSHDGLELTVSLIHNGESQTIIDGSVPDSAVEEGVRYTFSYTITVTGFITGASDLKVEILGQNGRIYEICGLAGILVVPP